MDDNMKHYPETCQGCILSKQLVNYGLCNMSDELAEVCPCSKCLVKSMCTIICKKREKHRGIYLIHKGNNDE